MTAISVEVVASKLSWRYKLCPPLPRYLLHTLLHALLPFTAASNAMHVTMLTCPLQAMALDPVCGPPTPLPQEEGAHISCF